MEWRDEAEEIERNLVAMLEQMRKDYEQAAAPIIQMLLKIRETQPLLITARLALEDVDKTN